MMRAGDRFIAGHGVATVTADLDFETYSEAGYVWNPETQKWQSLPGLSSTSRGLPAVGVYNYVTHPSFEVLSLAYDLKDGLGPRWWRPEMPDPGDLLYHVRSGFPIEAHNFGFEWHVWMLHCVPRYGWPKIRPESERCSQAKAKAWSLPSALADIGPALRLPDTLQKDSSGSRLIQKLTVPKAPSKKDPGLRWTPETAPDDFQAFYRYNVQDIVSEGAISIRIPDLPPRELEIWRVDQAINRRGMQIDLQAVDHCIAIVEQCTGKYGAELQAITNHRVMRHTEVAQTLAWLGSRGVHLPALDEEIVEEQLLQPHAPDVKRVLEIRKLLSFGCVKKLYAMRAQTGDDGRLREQYAYHGAHTGLWNGRGVQVANLYKGKLDKPQKVERALATIASGSLDYVEGVYGDALECVADCLRSVIVARPGSRLIASDYNAIQAVVTAALAGEKWRMEVFRTHGKIYEMCASKITGKPLQFYLDYKKEHGKHHEDRQPLGKIPELASGFGGWVSAWKKFGASEFMTDEEIKAAILKWRAESPAVVELWGGQTRDRFTRSEREELYGLEGAAVAAVKYPGQCFAYRGIRYVVHDDVLYCQPPGNGTPLCYHEPRLTPSSKSWARSWEYDLSYMGWSTRQERGGHGWIRLPLYGGVLTQNVVAKVSREFQADSLVRCERSGIYLPVMHTHDEIVTEVPLGLGNVQDYLALVNQPRDGCSDEIGPWPVRAPSADETYRYGKWE